MVWVWVYYIVAFLILMYFLQAFGTVLLIGSVVLAFCTGSPHLWANVLLGVGYAAILFQWKTGAYSRKSSSEIQFLAGEVKRKWEAFNILFEESGHTLTSECKLYLDEIQSDIDDIGDQAGYELAEVFEKFKKFKLRLCPGENSGSEQKNGGDDDPLFNGAVRLVFEFGEASTSLLQRRLRIEYGRAAHLLDLMHRDGFVGPADGSKPREILKPPDWLSENSAEKETTQDENEEESDSDLAEKFADALRGLSVPILSVLVPMASKAGEPDPDIRLCFALDVAQVMGLLARSGGGISLEDAELFRQIAKSFSPSQFIGMTSAKAREWMERALKDSTSPVHIPVTLRCLKEYDRSHGTDEASGLALLYMMLARATSELQPDSPEKTSAAMHYAGRIMQFVGENGSAEADAEVPADDVYELLGVHSGCSGEELKAAYKRAVSQWHPDRLQHMAPELRQFATERLAKINVAYSKLSKSQSTADV
jgi:DnaJ-domain-containing protein 1